MDSALTINDCHMHTIAQGEGRGREGASTTACGRNWGIGETLECSYIHRAYLHKKTERQLPGCLRSAWRLLSKASRYAIRYPPPPLGIH